jgi:hypothetical protein
MDNKNYKVRWYLGDTIHDGKGCAPPSRLVRLFGAGGEGLYCRPGGYVSTNKKPRPRH